jgi:phage gp16-like protein
MVDLRKKFIKAIKTKQRQLGMDQETYKAMLLARTGQTSCTDCNLLQLGMVSEYLTGQGAVNPRVAIRPARRTNLAADRQLLRQRVDLLAAELVRVAGVTDAVKYVNAICVRNGWCTTVDFADAHILHKLVGALETTLKAKTRAANVAASRA